jgi:hypothetical protein
MNLREQALSIARNLGSSSSSKGQGKQQQQQSREEGSTSSLTILDIGEMRRAEHHNADASRSKQSNQSMSIQASSSKKPIQDAPFQLQASNRNSRYSRWGVEHTFEDPSSAGGGATRTRGLVDYEGCEGSGLQANRTVTDGDVGAGVACKAVGKQLRFEDLLVGPKAQRDLAAVATIFSSLSQQPGAAGGGSRHPGSSSRELQQEALRLAAQEELMEADYAVLLRDCESGRPLAAASMLLFGKDEKQGKMRSKVQRVPQS